VQAGGGPLLGAAVGHTPTIPRDRKVGKRGSSDAYVKVGWLAEHRSWEADFPLLFIPAESFDPAR